MAQLSLYDLNRLKLDATKEAADKLRIDAATINNGLTVQSSVPPNAKFTDTIYTHPQTHPANMITGLSVVATSGSYNDLLNKPANLPANGGNSDTVDSCHVNDNATTTTNLWTSKKTQDKLNEKENTIVFSGTTKPTKTCVWIDTTATVYSSTNAKFVNINGAETKTWHLETNDTQVKTQNNTSNLKNDLSEINRLIGTKADNVTVTQQKHGIMSKEDKIKLDGIATNANNYVHPSTHPASMITGLPTKLPANGGNSDTVGGKSVNDSGTGTAYLWTAGKIQEMLNGKANASHNHDDRYYTESEINTKLNGKSDTSHSHSNYITTGGGTINTNLTINSGAAQHVALSLTTNGSARWNLGKEADQGFAIWCYNDNGSYKSRPLYIDRNANLSIAGNITGARVYNAVYNDYAEWFEKQNLSEKLEPGDLICVGENDKYTKSIKAYDTCVIGVYSDTYGHIVGGEQLDNMEDNYKKFIPIGLSGRVSVKLVGKINKGDLIVSSNFPGIAMKMENFIPGTIIGKALEDKNTTGVEKVKMLILNS